MMNGLCTGVGWHERKLAFELRGEQDKRRAHVAAGDTVAFELVDGRNCIGHRKPGGSSLTVCDQGPLGKGLSAAQCPACFQAAHILPCLRCTGERCNNPLRRADCVQPENHVVYLASFAPGVVKVGVARHERSYERLAEQGARAAILIARDDGQQVRRMESQFRFADVPDRMSLGEKLRAYTLAADQAKLAAELQDVFARTRIRVLGQWLNEAEVVTLPDLPLLDAVPRLLRPHAGMRVRATCHAVLGGALILDTDTGERVALEASSLIGYELRELGEQEAGAGQLALAFG